MEEEKQVNKKKKNVIVTVVTIMALLLVIVGVSYAFWQQSKVQEGTNYIASGCFGVTFEGNNPINLANSFPITDEEGMKTVPYTFTITSSCNGKAAYDVNLESLASTTFQNTSIRLALDSTHKLYNEYEEAETYYNDSIESRRLVSGRLDDGESVTYNLRLWIDEAVTIEEQNKVFASKIVVNASEDFDDPVIENINATSTINSINITYNANGDISTTCKYGLTEGTYDNTVEDATTTDCNIEGLTDDTTYYYQVCTETGRGTKCETGNVTTLIDSPEPSITNLSAKSTHNSITITYSANGDVGTTCKYGTSTSYGSSASSATNSKCSITGLNENTTYYYQICTETRKGNICKTGNIKTVLPIASQVKIGDYISMTPTSTSYTISKGLTGSTIDQKINPSELNLWRVIRKNDDGTVDMVSQYTSSTALKFYGKMGYKNYLGTLNLVASKYESKFTQGSRIVGYSGDVETCESVNTSECTVYEGNLENLNDLKLIYNAIGSRSASVVGTREKGFYWLGVRIKYIFMDSYQYAGVNGYVETCSNCQTVNVPFCYQTIGSGSVQDSGASNMDIGVRPVVILKSTVRIKSGSGTSSSPYTIQ